MPPNIKNHLPPLDARNHLTSEEFVEQHELTKFLKELGLSDAQLENVRFKKNSDDPYSQWRAQATTEWPPGMEDHLQAWCTFRWLILEEPPYSRDRDDAHTHLAIYLAKSQLQAGLKVLEGAQAAGRASNQTKQSKATKFIEQYQKNCQKYSDKNTTWLVTKTAQQLGTTKSTAWRYYREIKNEQKSTINPPD